LLAAIRLARGPGIDADVTAHLRNPHITAAAPISYDFDPYEDLARPAGSSSSR